MNETKYKPIKINFTVEEYDAVKDYARQCGITVVEFCRLLLNGYHPKPMPVPAFREALNQLYKLHNLVRTDEHIATHLRTIILNFQKKALLPERRDMPWQ